MPTAQHQPADRAAAKTNAAAYAYLEALVKETGDPTMCMQQVRLLLALAVHGTLDQGDLERHTAVRKSSNARNITRLGVGSYKEAGLGLVKSEEDEKDRRYKRVMLTAKGRAVMESAAAQAAPFFGPAT